MRKIFRRVQQYVKHELKEIVAPSALPEPPGEVSRRLTAAEIWKVVTLGTNATLVLKTTTLTSSLQMGLS